MTTGPMITELVSTSAAMTRALGAALATELGLGAVVVLSGDLGSGKTVFAQGVAAGLGVTERVVSPTFAIAREYSGRLPLHHLDVYRLDHVQEAIDLGLDELFDDAVTLIEWGEGVRDLLPADRLEVELALDPADVTAENVRRITLSPIGPRWSERASAIADALRAVDGVQDQDA